MTSIAIDGPAGAGKSTVALAVADSLGYRYLDTGSLYRAVALAALEENVDPSDAFALSDLLGRSRLELEGGRVRLNGRDVTTDLRAEAVTRIVSVVSAHPEVRAGLLEVQRAAADTTDVVMEGRDIGTTVLPHADLKIFLTATPTERARRRSLQLGLEEDAPTVTAVEESLKTRDEADSRRVTSPLTQPVDAIVIDTSAMTLDEVVGTIVTLARGLDGSG